MSPVWSCTVLVHNRYYKFQSIYVTLLSLKETDNIDFVQTSWKSHYLWVTLHHLIFSHHDKLKLKIVLNKQILTINYFLRYINKARWIALCQNFCSNVWLRSDVSPGRSTILQGSLQCMFLQFVQRSADISKDLVNCSLCRDLN